MFLPYTCRNILQKLWKVLKLRFINMEQAIMLATFYSIVFLELSVTMTAVASHPALQPPAPTPITNVRNHDRRGKSSSPLAL